MYVALPILRQLQRAGAKAYLAKDETPRTLVSAIERVLAGDPFFASTNAYRNEREIEFPEYIPAPYPLTPRELDVSRFLRSAGAIRQLPRT